MPKFYVKIRECPGWDSVLKNFDEFISQIVNVNVNDNCSIVLVKWVVFSEKDYFFYNFACQTRQVILGSIVMNKFFIKGTCNIT